MAGSLKTTNYQLAKYAPDDITSWLTDFNGNMDLIDAGMQANKQAATQAQDGVDNLKAEYESLLQTVNGHTTSISANEKAIAANTAMIAELGDEVDAIVIGEYVLKQNTDSDVTKIENLAKSLFICARRVGNGVQVSGSMEFTPGFMHVYDRQIANGVYSGRYVTDIYRITANPFNLPPNVYCPFTAMGANVKLSVEIESTTYDIATAFRSIPMVIAYLPESSYTVIGLTASTTGGYGIGGGDNVILGLA